MVIVKSKSGKVYYYPKARYFKEKPPRERKPHRILVSKNGNTYLNYYQKKNKTPTSSKYIALCRKLIDHNRCRFCGSTKNLHVHHRDGEGYHKTKKPNNNMGNLITLCASCHFRHHSGWFKRYIDIIERLNNGDTFENIGNYYRVSRQRIHQIVAYQGKNT